jgi:tetratricopeptide (TPR) repeat protein
VLSAAVGLLTVFSKTLKFAARNRLSSDLDKFYCHHFIAWAGLGTIEPVDDIYQPSHVICVTKTRYLSLLSGVPGALFGQGLTEHLPFFTGTHPRLKATMPQNPELQTWYDQGNALFNVKRFEGAVARFDKLLNQQPEHHEAWTQRGFALYELGSHEEAIASFERSLQIKPKVSLSWHGKGIAQAKLGRYEQAIISFSKAIKYDPENAKIWYNQGHAYSCLYRYKEAIASFDKAIEFKPDNYRAWYSRAVSLASLRRYEDAFNSLDTTLAIKRSCYYAWNYRGLVLTKLNRHEEAIASFDKSLGYKSDNPNAWYGKASSYALRQDVEMAVKNLHRAIILSPNLYRVMAQTDMNFDAIRKAQAFQELMQKR